MIKPYYEEKDITIYHGDCLEIMKELPDKSIDLVLTDPPYGIGFKAKGYADIDENNYLTVLNLFNDFKKAFISYPEESMKYFVKAWGCPDEVLAWCYNSNISRQFRLVNIYGSNVNYSLEKQKCKNPNDERVNEFVDMYDWFCDIQLVKNVSNEKTDHPCPVPVKLMSRIVKLTDSYYVLDPFLGSGTTAVACKELNRKCIGIEISEKYCEIAVKRLKNTIKPMF